MAAGPLSNLWRLSETAKTSFQQPIRAKGASLTTNQLLANDPPAVVYRLMDSQSDAKQAIVDVLGHAKWELMIFDQSATSMMAREYGRPFVIDILRNLLMGSHNSRARRIRIALHDARGIEGEMPRLISLLGQYADLMSIRVTTDAARSAQDVMLIADDNAIWRKPVASHPRSVLTMHDVNEVKPFLDRFEEIWASSEPAVSTRSTGL